MKKNSELRNIAKNLKAAAVKPRKAAVAAGKITQPVKKSWFGCHSELPTDTRWNKIRFGVFDAVKGDRGDNRAIVAGVHEMMRKKV